MAEKLSIKSKHCGKENFFEQPYAYHAGFGERGFLYDETGTLTLTWSAYDPAFEEMFPQRQPYALTEEERSQFEEKLVPAPSGSRWLFCNPARCVHCGEPICSPMMQHIYYVVYPGSIDSDQDGKMRLCDYLKIA